MQLRERLSSTLQMREQERESSAGRALAEDAERTASRIDVRDAFPMRLERRHAGPRSPFSFRLACSFFRTPSRCRPILRLDSAELTQIKNSTADLAKLVREQREKAEEEGLKSCRFLEAT